jgi:RNA 2',3'-cyclic 3'-phosphodiesterase
MFDQMEARPLRLFFGLSLPLDLRASLAHWRRAYSEIEGWSKAEGLHLTLAFLGQRPLESLPGLEELSKSVAARHGAFELCTASLGTFSRFGTTRLLWLGLTPSPALAALAEDLRRTLLAGGETIDTKPFHPHLTLARFRQVQPMAGFADPMALRFTADRLTLFESRPQGCYTGLQSWPLQRV